MKPRHAAPVKQDAAARERQRIRQLVHDLNTPLSALTMQLFLRRKSLAHPTPQDLHSFEILDRNVERIRTLVASLLPTAEAPASTQLAVEATQPTRPRRRSPTW